MLQDIRSSILALTDYDPMRQDYYAWLDAEINKAYKQLALFRVWPWATAHEVPINIYADVHADCTCTNGSNQIVAGAATFDASFEGRTVVIGAIEYTASKYVSPTQLNLDSVYTGVTGLYNVSIEHRHIVLPQDCERLLYAVCRDEQEVYYNEDTKVANINYLDRSTVSKPYAWVWAGQRKTPTPTEPPTLVSGAVPGTVTPGTYEIGYTYTRLGVESALSETATVVVNSGVNQSITVTLPSTGFNSGFLKTLYVRRVHPDRPKAFRRTTTDIAETIISISYLTPMDTNWTGAAGVRLLETGGQAQLISMLRRQDADRLVQITYLRRLESLIELTDVPAFTETFEDYLVHAVAAKVFQRNERLNSYNASKREASMQLARIEARFLTQEQSDLVLGNAWLDGRIRHADAMPIYIGDARIV